MPLGKHYGGKGAKVMRSMKETYGKDAERVFYATENKMKGKGKCMTCMGRKVEYHSPAKHPEQDDAMAEMLMKADKGMTSGTYSGMRKDMKPIQADMPRDKPQGALDYLKGLLPSGRKK